MNIEQSLDGQLTNSNIKSTKKLASDEVVKGSSFSFLLLNNSVAHPLLLQHWFDAGAAAPVYPTSNSATDTIILAGCYYHHQPALLHMYNVKKDQFKEEEEGELILLVPACS
eukprot:scaffold10680_cov64-Attheya_sp.AAC.14